MRRFTSIIALLICAASARSETPAMLLEVTSLHEVRPGRFEYAPPVINVYSEKESQRKQNVSLTEAATILKHARGWHSQVLVSIVFHRDFLKPDDLITLLEGMKHNPELILLFVGPADSGSGKQTLESFRQLADAKP